MMRWFRKLRGILGLGALWGAVGAVLGSVVSVGVTLVTGIPLVISLSIWALGMTTVGFTLGAGFGAVLTVFDGRVTLDRLTPGRAARWGAVAGALFPVGWLIVSLGNPWATVPLGQLIPMLAAAGGIYGLTGGAVAATTVWLARRGSDRIGAGSSEPLLDAPGNS